MDSAFDPRYLSIYKDIRQAWTDSVRALHPNPKPAYTSVWEDMPDWEREAIARLFAYLRPVLAPLVARGIALPDEQRGYLVCSVWNIIMFQLLEAPKPAYVKAFDKLDPWQRQADISMCKAIEDALSQLPQEVTDVQ